MGLILPIGGIPSAQDHGGWGGKAQAHALGHLCLRKAPVHGRSARSASVGGRAATQGGESWRSGEIFGDFGDLYGFDGEKMRRWPGNSTIISEFIANFWIFFRKFCFYKVGWWSRKNEELTRKQWVLGGSFIDVGVCTLKEGLNWAKDTGRVVGLATTRGANLALLDVSGI